MSLELIVYVITKKVLGEVAESGGGVVRPLEVWEFEEDPMTVYDQLFNSDDSPERYPMPEGALVEFEGEEVDEDEQGTLMYIECSELPPINVAADQPMPGTYDETKIGKLNELRGRNDLIIVPFVL